MVSRVCSQPPTKSLIEWYLAAYSQSTSLYKASAKMSRGLSREKLTFAQLTVQMNTLLQRIYQPL